jgi:hypothetical integral membrane protein (TIGR02206 family)
MIAVVVFIGRRHRRQNNLARGVVDGPGQLLGALALVYWLCLQVWWNFPVRFGNDYRLPLQVCDLAGLIAGLALLSGVKWLNTTLYFWAFALSTQAFITPIVREGPALARFWQFFESHTIIVGAAVYIVAVRGYRPLFKDYLFGIGITVLYAAIILPLNRLTGWNYGYIGPSKPDAPTLIDALGPWPWRLLPLTGLVVGAMLIVWLPWVLADKFGKRQKDQDVSAPA